MVRDDVVFINKGAARKMQIRDWLKDEIRDDPDLRKEMANLAIIRAKSRNEYYDEAESFFSGSNNEFSESFQRVAYLIAENVKVSRIATLESIVDILPVPRGVRVVKPRITRIKVKKARIFGINKIGKREQAKVLTFKVRGKTRQALYGLKSKKFLRDTKVFKSFKRKRVFK